MAQDDKKKITPEIDEALMMSIMAEGVKQPGQAVTEIEPTEEAAENKPATREKNRVKKNTSSTYGERFLNSHTMMRRGEKSIYIRPEYHERLSRITKVIGEDKIPLYAYLDNILEHHFELFEKSITDDFNEKYKPIF